MRSENIFFCGLSCRLPKSDSPEEFWSNLIHGKDMVSAERARWPFGVFPIPKRSGKIRHPELFDSNFFEISGKQTEKLDPLTRLMLEVSYEAVLDAGYNPQELKGCKVGVFIGCMGSEASAAYIADGGRLTGYEASGISPAMLSNRISYFNDFTGPSITLDTACSSSLYALSYGIDSIRSGKCDFAIIGGANLIFTPNLSASMMKFQMLSPRGISKVFDRAADGYVRADGILSTFITTESRARRKYARIVNCVVNNDGHKREGITFPNKEAQVNLLRAAYFGKDLNPSDLVYYEAHGTGTPVGDPQEIAAVDEALCRKRTSKNPLLVGSVKSNVGHTEGSAGLTSVLKVLLAYHHGDIPPNLHFSRPDAKMVGILEGRIKVVTKRTPFAGGLTGISSFGFGGANAHLVLQGKVIPNDRVKGALRGYCMIPCSSRTEIGLDKLIKHVKAVKCRNDVAAFLQPLSSSRLNKMRYRGVVYRTSKGQCTTVKGMAPAQKPDLCYVFNGIGAQWPGMASDLMDLPFFRSSIDRCHKALTNTRFNLIRLLTHGNKRTFRNIQNTFPCLTAIQISLVDMLKSCGLDPDIIIGHSVGEIACGYADGCLSLEQAMQISYWRGRSIIRTKVPDGAMASVNLGMEQVQQRCPDGVFIACRNSEHNVTISGNREAVHLFVDQLIANNVDARIIDSNGKAFHSPLMARAGTMFGEKLKAIIPRPKRRSQRWICTSRPDNEWKRAGLCSAAYYKNNLLSPVFFSNALKRIPQGAVVIEIGAHSIFRGLLSRSVENIKYIHLMRRNTDNVKTLLNGLGSCYVAGLNSDYQAMTRNKSSLEALPRIPGLMAWDHQSKWPIPVLPDEQICMNFDIDLKDPQYHFLRDHKVNGKIIFPAMGYIFLVWKALSLSMQVPLERMPVQFEDVKLHLAAMMNDSQVFHFTVGMLSGTRLFEVKENNTLLMSGRVNLGEDIKRPHGSQRVSWRESEFILNQEDVYKEFRLRGFEYGENFQGIHKTSIDGANTLVRWKGNWITFMDSIAQTNLLLVDGRVPIVSTYYAQLTIDPLKHDRKQEVHHVHYDRHLHRKYCASFAMEGFLGLSLHEKIENRAILAARRFSPFHEKIREKKAAREYIKVLNAYSIQRAMEFFGQRRRLAPHLRTLKDLLISFNSGNKPPNKRQVQTYLNHPQGVYLRLIDHIYSRPKQINRAPYELVTGFPGYRDLYRNDLTDVLFNGDEYIRELLDIVRESKPAPSPISICEMGVQYSFFARRILKMMFSVQDRYVISDYGKRKFDRLKNELKTYSTVVDYKTWDIESEVLKGAYDLIIVSQAMSLIHNLNTALKNINDSLAEGGFLLLNCENGAPAAALSIWGLQANFLRYWNGNNCTVALTNFEWKKFLLNSGFTIVSVKECLRQSLVLCRKAKGHNVTEIIPFRSSDLQRTQQCFAALKDNPAKRLWLRGNESSSPGLIGLVKCLRKEPNGENVRCLFSAENSRFGKKEAASVLEQDLPVNIYKNGMWGAYRYREIVQPYLIETDSAYMQVQKKGSFSSLGWVKGPSAIRGFRLYDVGYCALNFKDIMLASGTLPAEAGGIFHDTPGFEFSGIRKDDGCRVMGIGGRTLATKVLAPRRNVPIWKIPDRWSLEDAATVPVVYLTVYLGLIIRAQLKKGDKVLIHCGSGGIGIAAINLARSMKCEVFTTAGNDEKRNYIKNKFPEIGKDHIFSSRDTSFEGRVRQQTNGQGVDVVLNSLPGDRLIAGIRALAMHGRFVEIGKLDMLQNNPIGMSNFLKDISIHGVDLGNTLLNHRNETQRLYRLFKKGLESGVVKPLDRTVFKIHQVEDAFRFMGQAKHIGKVLIRIHGENNKRQVKVFAKQKFACDPGKAYLITGGLGGFGLELADWLVRRGAKRLVLTSRNGIQNGYQSFRIQKLKTAGANVKIVRRNVRNFQSTAALIRECEEIAPVGGIFHLAMVMSDALFLDQNKDSFYRVCSVKLTGARNLSRVSSEICGQLDHFVCFSSIVAAEGNEGQTNYAYANAGMDQLCEQRKRRGLPALSIQWGPIGDVGFIQKNAYVDFRRFALGLQSIRSCLEALDTLLSQNDPVVTSFTTDNSLHQEMSFESLQQTSADFVNSILKIFGIQMNNSVDMNTPLNEFGMDSLMSTELRLILEYGFGIKLSVQELRKASINSLKKLFDNKESPTK